MSEKIHYLVTGLAIGLACSWLLSRIPDSQTTETRNRLNNRLNEFGGIIADLKRNNDEMHAELDKIRKDQKAEHNSGNLGVGPAPLIPPPVLSPSDGTYKNGFPGFFVGTFCGIDASNGAGPFVAVVGTWQISDWAKKGPYLRGGRGTHHPALDMDFIFP